MGFSLKSLDPTRSIKRATSSASNLARNPFDKDALKESFKGSQAFMNPVIANMMDERKRVSPQGGLEAALGATDSSAQQYIAPPQYQAFADLFNQPQFDYSQVGDVYARGSMPNNLLNRYNSLMSNLEQQQAAMVPRQLPQNPYQQPRLPLDPNKRPVMGGSSPYINFAQLFGGGRNG